MTWQELSAWPYREVRGRGRYPSMWEPGCCCRQHLLRRYWAVLRTSVCYQRRKRRRRVGSCSRRTLTPSVSVPTSAGTSPGSGVAAQVLKRAHSRHGVGTQVERKLMAS